MPTRQKSKRHGDDHHFRRLERLLIKQHTVELVKINELQKQLKKVMATIQELNDKADALQASVDAVQEKVATAVAAFEKQIADLQAIIDAGGIITPESLQPIADKLDAAKVDLDATPTA